MTDPTQAEPEVVAEPLAAPAVGVEAVAEVVAVEPERVITDQVAATSAPETALDAEGRRYMTGRLLHFNAGGDEVPAPTQAIVQKF